MFNCLNETEERKVKIEQAKRDTKKFSWEKFSKNSIEELKRLKKAND
jgi:hypothetical protein